MNDLQVTLRLEALEAALAQATRAMQDLSEANARQSAEIAGLQAEQRRLHHEMQSLRDRQNGDDDPAFVP